MSELFDRAKEEWLIQELTYWSPAQPDYLGDVAFGAPVLINCRWNKKQELIKDAEGRELTSKAKVHPETAVERQGRVALGDHTSTADPDDLDTTDVYEVLMTNDHDAVDQESELLTFWI